MKANEILTYLSFLYKGDYDLMFSHIKEKKKVEDADINAYLANNHPRCFNLLEPVYPNEWKNIYLPPLVCYYEGDVSLLKNLSRAVTFIGSRDASREGIANARKFGRELAKAGVTIVSGLARGIDASVMRGAMEERGKLIGVSGAGIDIDYPSGSADIYSYVRKNGLLLSEYPPGVAPKKDNFPKRNRILSATGKVLVVGEAAERSGSLITVSLATSMGKDVCCLPSPPLKGSACNSLIKDGAYLIDDPEDILALL